MLLIYLITVVFTDFICLILHTIVFYLDFKVSLSILITAVRPNSLSSSWKKLSLKLHVRRKEHLDGKNLLIT